MCILEADLLAFCETVEKRGRRKEEYSSKGGREETETDVPLLVRM